MITELLKPRFRVIADWPDMRERFKGNPIITMDTKDVEGWYTTNGYYQETFFTAYPHLFKKLAWWEERKLQDMPPYIVDIENKAIMYKVKQWHTDGCAFFSNHTHQSEIFYTHDVIGDNFLPATRADYETYLTTNKLNP